jgi:hypothetical protein
LRASFGLVISISSCDVTAHAVTTATPRRPEGTGGAEIRVREKGFSGGTSLCRGTTHAPFGSEVERKVSNLVAH